MSDFDKLFKRLDMLLDCAKTMVPAKTETRSGRRIAVQFAAYWESLK